MLGVSDSQGSTFLKDVLKDLDPSDISGSAVDACVKYFNDVLRKTNPGAVLTEKGSTLLLSRDDNATKVKGFRWLLEHIRPSTTFTWTNAKIESYEKGQVWLDPYSISDLDKSELKDEIVRRMSDETMIGGHVSLKGYLFCLIHVLPNLGVDNVFLRWLKKYIMEVDPEMDPYEDGHHESLINPKGDTHVRLRIFLLLQLAFYSHSFPQIQTDIWMEIGNYLFASPHRRSNELKGMINVHRQSAFCKSSTGTYLNHGDWSAAIERLPLGKYVPVLYVADQQYYDSNKEFIDEAYAKMTAAGMLNTRNALDRLLSAEINDANLAQYTVFYATTSLPGYTRSFALTSHLEQVGGKFPESTGAYTPYLEAFWNEFVIFAKDRLPTYGEFKALVATSWTSKSSGGWSFKVRTKVKELAKYTSVRKVEKDGGVEFKFSDKRMVFLRAGFELLRPELIRKGYNPDEKSDILDDFVDYFSEGMEGKVGARDVTDGKKRRAIIAQRAEHMAMAEVIAYLLQEYQEGRDEFTIGKQRGNPIDDHRDTLVVTGQTDEGEFYFYVMGADYEKFDASEKEENARGPDRRALVNALRKRGLTQAFGPWKDIAEIIEVIWGKGIGYDAVFVFGAGGDVQLVSLDQLLSGELMTLSLNNVHNLGNIQKAVANFSALPASERATIKKYVMMGDDSNQIVMCLNNFNLKDYEQLVNNMIETSASNGFTINKLKAVTRKRYGEYLKVRFLGGREIPLLQLQPMATERVQDVQHPRDQFSAIYSLFNTCVSRGFPHDTMYKMFFMLWLWKRNMKLYRVAKRGSLSHNLLYLNVDLLWLPRMLGGVGVYPGSLIGASTDLLILLKCVEDPDLKKRLDRAFFEISVDKANDVKRTVAQSLMGKECEVLQKDGTYGEKGRVFQKGIDAFQEVMLAERIRIAKRIVKKLPEFEDLAYYNMPKRAVEYSLMSDEKLVTLASVARQANSDLIWNQTQLVGSSDVLGEFSWLKSFRFIKTNLLDVLDPTNLRPILGNKMRTGLNVFGHSGNPDEIAVRPVQIFGLLRKDPFFPREFSDEKLMSIMFRQDMLDDPDRMVNFLMLIGARTDLAGQVVEKVKKMADSFSFVNGLPGFSKNDQYMILFNLSRESHMRVVNVRDMPDLKVANLLLQLGLFKSFLDGFHSQRYYALRVELGSTSIDELNKLVHGWYTTPGKRIDVIPRKEWEWTGQD